MLLCMTALSVSITLTYDWHDTRLCDAAAVILPYPAGTYVRSPYNAYETVVAQSCSTSTKGCCSSTSLTSLVFDTSVIYNCYALNDPGVNDFAISVRLSHAMHLRAD